MTENAHPTYPNPTIQEALCEIVFRPQEGPGNPLAFSQFFDHVKAEFPVIEAVPSQVISLQIGPDAMQSSPARIPSLQIIRYRHHSRPLLLQLADNRIIVNSVGNYPGWQQFKTDIEYVWQKITTVLHPLAILRIDLRYINRIEPSTPDQTLGNWLVSTEYVPEAILRSQTGFLSQVRAKLNKDEVISVVAAEVVDPTTGRAFIFDIERIVERETSVDLVSLLSEIERLHTDVWNVFSSAKNEKLDKLLRGELS